MYTFTCMSNWHIVYCTCRWLKVRPHPLHFYKKLISLPLWRNTALVRTDVLCPLSSISCVCVCVCVCLCVIVVGGGIYRYIHVHIHVWTSNCAAIDYTSVSSEQHIPTFFYRGKWTTHCVYMYTYIYSDSAHMYTFTCMSNWHIVRVDDWRRDHAPSTFTRSWPHCPYGETRHW